LQAVGNKSNIRNTESDSDTSKPGQKRTQRKPTARINQVVRGSSELSTQGPKKRKASETSTKQDKIVVRSSKRSKSSKAGESTFDAEFYLKKYKIKPCKVVIEAKPQ
jgi:hypothetical protein